MQRTLIAQPVVEPGLKDVLAIMSGGIGAEIDGPETAAIPSPLPMIPRTGNEVVPPRGIVLLEKLVDFLGTVEILLIPPAGGMDYRNFHGGEVGREGEPLPEGIVVGVMEEVLPGGQFFVEIALVGVGEWTEAKVEIER